MWNEIYSKVGAFLVSIVFLPEKKLMKRKLEKDCKAIRIVSDTY